jgi:phospholipid N-methyltransferase
MRHIIHYFRKNHFHGAGAAGYALSSRVISKAGHAILALPPVLFTRALFANPRAVGAFCPSSSSLAHTIAREVPTPCEGLVVELGGGTGAVTHALLKRGIEPRQLTVVERDHLMARHLKNRFPQITVIHGDAVRFCRHLHQNGRQIQAVVSSLPLLSLPAMQVAAVGSCLQEALAGKGMIVQYTYRVTSGHSPLTDYFQPSASKVIWTNLPPARVEVFRHRLM